MKRRSATMIAIATVCSGLLASAGAASGTQAAAAARAAPGGTWGNAMEVAAGLSQGGDAQLNSVSCASAGNCSAGGSYFSEVFVVSEKSGTWGTAKEVPGFAALNQGGNAQLASVSCASAGHCSAVGFYTTRPRNGFNEAFVVNET